MQETSYLIVRDFYIRKTTHGKRDNEYYVTIMDRAFDTY